MGKVKVWTQDEIDRLKRLSDRGLLYEEIACELGRSKTGVYKKMNKMGYKKEYPHLYKVGDIVNKTLKIVKQIRIKQDNGTVKGYLVKSLAYPDDKNDYEVKEGHLKRGRGCAYVTGNRVCEESSLWSIENIRPYIVDVEEAKIVSRGSKKKINVKCVHCDKEKEVTINNLTSQRFSCLLCDKRTSYPELLFMSYNEVLDLKFIPQQIFKDFKDYRFDFVNYKKKIIVETHGLAHYNKEHNWYERTHESDLAKRQYCKENNWTLIELDCRESSFEFICNSIQNENLLKTITNEEIKNILDIMEINKRHPITEIIELYTVKLESTIQIGKRFRLCDSAIGRILRKHNVNMRNADCRKRAVKCLEMNVTYDSATEAQGKTGIGSASIGENCKGNRKSAGKHPITREKLHWEYVD